MCDYSLENYQSRPAVIGDRLVSYRFGSGTVGFHADAARPSCPENVVAVCLRPGTELAFDQPVCLAKPVGDTEQRTAIFRRVNEHLASQHHDCLELANGSRVMLTWLLPGQRVTVLQLPAAEAKDKAEAKAQAANS